MAERGPTSLDHYLSVRDGRRKPRFQQARAFPLRAGSDPWRQHAGAVRRLHAIEAAAPSPRDLPASPSPERSLLDLKIALADRLMQACDLCPHHCLVDRTRGDTGYCGVADRTAVHWEGILHGEEIEVVPSHEVFLSGCTMRCAFCYSHKHITRPMSGIVTTPEELAGTTAMRRSQGAINLNLVGGEPTVHIPNILSALRALDQPIPIIWNSNMYATPQA